MDAVTYGVMRIAGMPLPSFRFSVLTATALVAAVASRVLIVWVYGHTRRSVFAPTVVHASDNVSWQLFPIQGLHWDPRIDAIVAVIIAAVLSVWPAHRRLWQSS